MNVPWTRLVKSLPPLLKLSDWSWYEMYILWRRINSPLISRLSLRQLVRLIRREKEKRFAPWFRNALDVYFEFPAGLFILSMFTAAGFKRENKFFFYGIYTQRLYLNCHGCYMCTFCLRKWKCTLAEDLWAYVHLSNSPSLDGLREAGEKKFACMSRRWGRINGKVTCLQRIKRLMLFSGL